MLLLKNVFIFNSLLLCGALEIKQRKDIISY